MWHSIFFNSQSIQRESERSVLIKMPNRSSYNGYAFWHSKKLVREQGGKGYHLTFRFPNDYIFHVKLYGCGRYNSRDVINEVELTAREMMIEFGVVNESVNESVVLETEKIIAKETVIVEVIHHTPERIEPLKNNTVNSLKK